MQVQFEKIPSFLKSYAQFCNWKYEQRDGNQTKVPYIPGTTRRASVSDPATFAAFDAAASATDYDGIGIRVSGKIVGIDLDHCIENGKLLPWAQAIVDRFDATYIEVSPSGTGIRIFCLLPDGFTYDTQTYYIKKGDIEVYIPGHTNRFLTVTGNALTEADVAETAEALVWLLDAYMRRPTPPTPSAAVPGTSYLSDDSVIAKASEAKNGEKFRRLWSGDITGYPSRSEADAALTSMLAFWCGGDAGQIDDGYSGTTFDRPAWNRLSAMIDEGLIGTIIVKDMSRLGRDYLQVGMYTEMVFPNADIRFIAINNGVDSINGTENDMTPFINIFNEFYAKDIAHYGINGNRKRSRSE